MNDFDDLSSKFSDLSSLINLNINSNESTIAKHLNNNQINKSNIFGENKHTDSTLKAQKQTSFCHIDEGIKNKVYIDVAVVSEEHTKIELMSDDHILNLDEIEISLDGFQSMFYPYKQNFGINRDLFLNNTQLLPFISFSPNFRTINGKTFNLLEEIIGNIESDLCVSRVCFTKESLVELTNEITSIKTFLDIKCRSVLSSLSWTNILDIISDYEITKSEVIPILIINIIFKSDTPDAKDTIIRFQYKICSN
jgi:hypothetical protein